MKILLLDNDTAYSSKLKSSLIENGYEVAIAAIPMEALLSIHDNGAPDLLIMEMKLPAVSGYDFIQQLRRENAFPIVVLSEYGRDEDFNLAYSLGVFDYILKNSGFDEALKRVVFNINAVAEINKLIESNREQTVNLELLPLERLLKFLRMTYRNAEITFGQNDAKIIAEKGNIRYASFGSIEGEAALCYLINRSTGDFTYRSEFDKTINKNIEVDIFEKLIYYRELNDKFDRILTLIPYKRRDTIIDSADIRKQYYFNLIDNRSSVTELAVQDSLEQWLSVYYFTLLEKEQIIKLVDRESIPGALYPPLHHPPAGIRVLFAGKPPQALDDRKEIKEIQEIRDEDDALSKIDAFKPDVIVWDAASSNKINHKLLKHLMLINPVPVILNTKESNNGNYLLMDVLRFGVVDINFISDDTNEENSDKRENVFADKLIRIAGINVKSIQHIKLKSYKRAHDEQMPVSDNLIIMNASQGSYSSLLRIIPHLPGNLKTSVIILSDIDQEYLQPFVQYLNVISEMKIKLSGKQEVLREGTCYFVSKNDWAKFSKDGEKYLITLSLNEQSSMKTVDQSMYSAAAIYKAHCTGVFLSGISDDGVSGMGAIKWNHGYTIVQYPGTCIMPEGPLAALKVNVAHEVVVIDKISEKLLDHIMAITNII